METVGEILEKLDKEPDMTVTPFIQKETTAVQPYDVQTVTPLAMIDRAISSGASVETLERLMALQERYEATQARREFETAMAKAKAKFKPIVKRHEGYGNRYKYEKLQDVANAIDDALSEFGFSYDWDTHMEGDGRVTVTCIIRHEAGHSRTGAKLSETPKDVADAKANMNSAQRLAAAVTYLQRATLKASLGLAAGDDRDGAALPDDTDGGAPQEPPKPIDQEQYKYLLDLLTRTGSKEADMLKWLKATDMKDLTQQQFKAAETALKKKLPQVKQ